MSIKNTAIYGGSFLITICIWLLFPLYLEMQVPETPDPNDSETIFARRGQYGDMYGVLTSFFSGLTFIGLIYTISQQHKQLKIAQQAADDQRKELELAREDAANQSKTLAVQRFENTFFKMLELHSSIISEVQYTYFVDKENAVSFLDVRKETISGKPAVKYEYEKLLTELNVFPFDSKNSDQYYRLAEKYESFLENIDSKLDRYFINIETIEKFIQKSTALDTTGISFYMNLFASQLDSYELILYFYHATLHLNARYDLNDTTPTLLNKINRLYLRDDSHTSLFETPYVNGDV